MAITRITAVWQGFRGAPGYSNFFFGGAFEDETSVAAAAGAVRSFFFAVRPHLPVDVSVAIQPVADIIDEANGNITSQLDFDSPDTVTGGGTGGYSAATGAVVNWNTAAYKNGRRIRGRTFLVPLAAASFDSQGDLDNATLGDLRSATDYLTSGASPLPFVVWSRPTGGAGGSAEPVVSATVPDLGAVLRSRRD